jgi:hypothetical protein
MTEFVHRDKDPSSPNSSAPGNVRSWYVSSGGVNPGSYHFKVNEYPLNAQVDRFVGGVEVLGFNHLPFGSFHSGGAHFMMGDTATTFINDNIDRTVYINLSTINGGEVASLP